MYHDRVQQQQQPNRDAMAPAKLNYRISVSTFYAKSYPSDECCGSDGLSNGIHGRSQNLKGEVLRHENLCQYLDVIRGKYERTIIMQEYAGSPLTEVFIGEITSRKCCCELGSRC